MLIDKSTGEYIARQDADDISSKDRILFQYESVESQMEQLAKSNSKLPKKYLVSHIFANKIGYEI